MSRCLLEGHSPQQVRGVGAYASHTFTVCAHCNKPLDSAERLAQIEREAMAHVAVQANALAVNGDYR